MNLQKTFSGLSDELHISTHYSNILWDEIEADYSSEGRYYHTLEHIESMFLEYIKHKDKIQDHTAIQLAIFYHDIVYNINNTDNEIQSAML